MVTKKTICCVGRRMLLAFLASAGTAGVSGLPAAAQTGGTLPTVGGPVISTGLNDVTLAPGEKLVNSSTTFGGNTIQHGGGSYQIIDSSSVPMANVPMADPMMSEMPVMGSQLMHGGYSGGCATGNCGGGCATGSCGYGGSYASGQGLGMGGNACGPTCNPYLYAAVDALYVLNTNVDNYTRSTAFALEDFDYEFGVRGTLGMVPDCRNGMEVSFVTPIEWETERTATGAGFNSLLRPIDGLPVLSSFNNATFQRQRYESEYTSFEVNRTLIGWEICKLLYGIRYVDYEETYRYDSVSAAGAGVLRSNTQNQLFGAQIGAEMTFPLSCKMWSDFRGRAGAYADFAESDLLLGNANNVLFRTFDDDVELAGIFEIGGGVRYYFTDDFHIRGGGELWYMTGVATAIDQFNSRLSPNSGRRVNVDDDVLMVGISVGAELKF